MLYIIASGVIMGALIYWIMAVQRTLMAMDENIYNAMSQIGIQTSSRWDALTLLLELIQGYAEHEYKTIKETIQERSTITKDSSPDDVMKQANIIDKTKEKIMAVAESNPDLKTDSTYIKTMKAVNQYESMISTSRLIYNDTVTKLNRAIRMFPTSIAAVILGFSKRTYLEG